MLSIHSMLTMHSMLSMHTIQHARHINIASSLLELPILCNFKLKNKWTHSTKFKPHLR